MSTNAIDFEESLHERVDREQVDLLFRGARVALLSSFLGPVLCVWLFYELVGPWLALGPALVVVLLHVERGWFLQRFTRARASAGYRSAGWAKGLALRLCVMGAAIALWSFAAVHTGNETVIFYALGLCVCLGTGALTQYCIYPRALAFYITPLLLGMTAQLLWLSTKNALVAAVFLFGLWATFLAAGLRFGRVMRNDIGLRLRNDVLLAQLSAQKEKAESASAAKSRFLAAASHDLRQPVHAIMLLSAALQECTHDDGAAQLLRRLRGGVNHFADSVDEIMDIAQLDAGAVQVSIQPVRLTDLLARLDSTYHELCVAKGVGLLLRPPASPEATVDADPALLWRLASNLVGNAVRYTVTGSVLVAVRPDSSLGRAGLRLEVRDSGPGIAPELHERIFEEFFQVGNLHRDRRDGIGLGLAVGRRLAELMGLRIRLRSRPGLGSVFSIALPLCAEQAGRLPAPAAQDTSARLDLHVLVVDDDEASRVALAMLLSSWGAHAHAAGDAREAGALAGRLCAQGTPPQVLLTDHWLPEGQLSFDVQAAVQQALDARLPGAEPLPVAVFTGDIAQSTRYDILARGWMFWSKPARPLLLRMWLDSVREQQRRGAAAAAGT